MSATSATSPARRSLRRTLAESDHLAARTIRRARRGVLDVSIPAPKLLVKPVWALTVFVQEAWEFALRVFVCEPLFKAACRSYGRRVHTGRFLHYIRGKGDIIVGDDVLMDGKSSIVFGARFADRPALTIGSRTGIGHHCHIGIGKSITIGSDCRIASDVILFDSPGHPLDPEPRRLGAPPADHDVKPIRIGDNVWIGRRAIIGPGVTVGDNSVIAAGAVVLSDVAPNAVVAGNPARRIADLTQKEKGPRS